MILIRRLAYTIPRRLLFARSQTIMDNVAGQPKKSLNKVFYSHAVEEWRMKTLRPNKLLEYLVLVIGISWISWGLLVALAAGSVMGHAFILTWLFNKTQNVPLCVAYHAAANTLAALISLPAGMDYVENAIRLLLGIILIVLCRYRNRTCYA